jgi:fatty acid desaturase
MEDEPVAIFLEPARQEGDAPTGATYEGHGTASGQTRFSSAVRKGAERHPRLPAIPVSASCQEAAPMSKLASTPSFSLPEARKLVADLFAPKPWIYWTDFLLSFAIGMICFRIVRQSPLFAPQQIVCFVISGLAFFRLTIFTHEMVHLRGREFRGFRFAWNLLVGIPFLMPSFTYYTHMDHHRRKFFGTDKDGEYLPLGTSPPRAIFYYLSQVLVIPALAVLRFGLVTPLTWISPRLRRWVHRHASSMVADPSYLRPLPTQKDLRVIRLQEFLVFGFLLIVGVGMYRQRQPIFQNPLGLIAQAYCTAVFILALNAIRTLGAHRYLNAGGEMTFVDQLLDSVNYPRRPLLTELWAPLGMRFHALHHLFPSMPYHALPEAHRRLKDALPGESQYHGANYDGLPGLVSRLVAGSARGRAA